MNLLACSLEAKGDEAAMDERSECCESRRWYYPYLRLESEAPILL